MKTLLSALTSEARTRVTIGAFDIYAYDDGTLTARQHGSGLMAPSEKPTLAGLSRILKWIDSEAR